VTSVAACALLVKREVVLQIGSMDQSYFVYWDDIEWCRRCKDAGYRLVALPDAKVWHNWSANEITKFNPFVEYYGRRNKLRFFATYIEPEKVEHFIEGILRGIFNIIYGHYRKGAIGEMNTTLYALDDFIHGVWGKAEPYKIQPAAITELPFERVVKNSKKIVVIPNDQQGGDGGYEQIVQRIHFVCPEMEVIPGDVEVSSMDIKEDDSVTFFKVCDHVTRVKEDIFADSLCGSIYELYCQRGRLYIF